MDSSMLGQISGNPGAAGSEFLPEFKAIHNKLKKRFLRKPNVSEASDQFSKLARKMQSKEEPQYEGLCQLAVARCERALGNAPAEAEALVVAARSFLKAEEKARSIGCLSLEDHFQAAIQNYSLAIQTQIEDAGNSFAATGLCFEMAESLVKFQKYSEAATYFQKAAELSLMSSGSDLDYVRARERVANCLIDLGDYQNALHTLTEVAAVTEQIGGRPPTSVYKDILARCEVLRVLLLLLIDPTPQMMSPIETSILEKYSWESSVPSSSSLAFVNKHPASPEICTPSTTASATQMLPSPPTYLPNELFLLLQSLVMSVQLRDTDSLLQLEDYLIPIFNSEPRQQDILRLLVSTVKEKGQ